MAPVVLPGHEVLLSGQVLDSRPGGFAVSFAGAVSASTTTDSAGSFSVVTGNATLGTVDVTASNPAEATVDVAAGAIAAASPSLSFALTYDPLAAETQQNTLGTATADVAVNAPSVTLNGSDAGPQTVTLAGTVRDIDAAGLTVTFSGVAAGSTVTDANGNFSYTTSFSGAGAIDAATTDLWGQASNTAEVDVTAAPTVTLATQVLPGHQVLLTGAVSGADAAGATVTFSGAVSGSTTADANGNFAFTTSAAALGTVKAVAVDSQQRASAPAAATIAENAPAITLAVTSTSADTVTLSGNVNDVDAAGASVAIRGALNAMVTTDANGNFSFTLATADLGAVDVSTTDLWGEASNTAEVAANAFPPVIQTFTATQSDGGAWIFQGTVVAPNLQGLTITFGGLASLAGQTVTVAANGTFTLVKTLANGEYGTATAQTTDLNGQNSNLASAIVG